MIPQASDALKDLHALCAVEPDRRPGSPGNDAAIDYVAGRLRGLGWAVALQEFPCLDWDTGGGTLTIGDTPIELTPSPYGTGVDAAGPIKVIATVEELEAADLQGVIAVLGGALTAEPLTPKAFPFYGSDEHTRIINALEEKEPAAVVAVTGKYPELCGALDPYPLIEDGDFPIPAASLRPDQAEQVLAADGLGGEIRINSQRIPSRARNVIATQGPQSERITLIAHIDTKPGTPGAVDNAAGVVALLALAELISPNRGLDLPIGIELLIVNGEDHFAAPGEVAWLEAMNQDLSDITLAVNIDGAGYRGGRSAFSTYNVAPAAQEHIDAVFSRFPGLMPGPDWYQSDHAIFAMRGHPALAFTTEKLGDLLENVFHAKSDTPEQVDITLLTEIAAALADLLTDWPS